MLLFLLVVGCLAQNPTAADISSTLSEPAFKTAFSNFVGNLTPSGTLETDYFLWPFVVGTKVSWNSTITFTGNMTEPQQVAYADAIVTYLAGHLGLIKAAVNSRYIYYTAGLKMDEIFVDASVLSSSCPNTPAEFAALVESSNFTADFGTFFRRLYPRGSTGSFATALVGTKILGNLTIQLPRSLTTNEQIAQVDSILNYLSAKVCLSRPAVTWTEGYVDINQRVGGFTIDTAYTVPTASELVAAANDPATQAILTTFVAGLTPPGTVVFANASAAGNYVTWPLTISFGVTLNSTEIAIHTAAIKSAIATILRVDVVDVDMSLDFVGAKRAVQATYNATVNVTCAPEPEPAATPEPEPAPSPSPSPSPSPIPTCPNTPQEIHDLFYSLTYPSPAFLYFAANSPLAPPSGGWTLFPDWSLVDGPRVYVDLSAIGGSAWTLFRTLLKNFIVERTCVVEGAVSIWSIDEHHTRWGILIESDYPYPTDWCPNTTQEAFDYFNSTYFEDFLQYTVKYTIAPQTHFPENHGIYSRWPFFDFVSYDPAVVGAKILGDLRIVHYRPINEPERLFMVDLIRNSIATKACVVKDAVQWRPDYPYSDDAPWSGLFFKGELTVDTAYAGDPLPTTCPTTLQEILDMVEGQALLRDLNDTLQVQVITGSPRYVHSYWSVIEGTTVSGNLAIITWGLDPVLLDTIANLVKDYISEKVCVDIAAISISHDGGIDGPFVLHVIIDAAYQPPEPEPQPVPEPAANPEPEPVPSPIPCTLGPWSAWSDCACASPPVQTRARAINQTAAYGGAECLPNATIPQTQSCTPANCYRPCSGSEVLSLTSGDFRVTSTGFGNAVTTFTLSFWFNIPTATYNANPLAGFDAMAPVSLSSACSGDFAAMVLTKFSANFTKFAYTACNVGGNDGPAFSSLTSASFLDTWHHMLIVRNNWTTYAYVNGELIYSHLLPFTVNANYLVIGRRGAGGLQYRGLLSDIAYWSTALDYCSIQKVYAGEMVTTGLGGWWRGKLNPSGQLQDFYGNLHASPTSGSVYSSATTTCTVASPTFTPLCPIPCTYSSWSAWSVCPAGGSGSQTRTRTILQEANGGDACNTSLTSETQVCIVYRPCSGSEVLSVTSGFFTVSSTGFGWVETFTASLWFYLPSTISYSATAAYIPFSLSSSCTGDFGMMAPFGWGSGLRQYGFTVCNVGGYDGPLTNSSYFDTWHHMLVVRNTSYYHTYVDGQLVNSFNMQNGNPNANYLTIGKRGAGGSQYVGLLSDIAYWSTPLDYCSIQRVYAGERVTTGLQSWWRGNLDGSNRLVDSWGSRHASYSGSGVTVVSSSTCSIPTPNASLVCQ